MRKLTNILLSATLATSFIGCSKNVAPLTLPDDVIGGKTTMSQKGVQDFDLYFLQYHSEDKNEIYSPMSMKYALAMLSDGANGQTKSEIDSVLGTYVPKTYQNSQHMALTNALFVNEKYDGKIKQSYMDTIREKYNGELLFDAFKTPEHVNNWVSEKSLSLIHDFADDSFVNTDTTYVLINALAIDMDWDNRLQATATGQDTPYIPAFRHEKYSDYIDLVGEQNTFSYIDFNGNHYKGSEIGVSCNRYNLIEDFGEENVRKTLEEEYQKWLDQYPSEKYDDGLIDRYVQEIKDNYNQNITSTNFQFYVDDSVQVFAKDLKEYDGTTLEYVAFMPKDQSLSDFIKNSDSQSINSLMSNLKDANDLNSYNDGVITKVIGFMPFFDYEYEIDFAKDLKTLGIETVFDKDSADLSNIMDNTYIENAKHKATITLSNDGIKAAAVTAMAGGLGAGGIFDYQFDVPIEIINIEFNKPFMYLIRDKQSGEIWFMGKMYEGVKTDSSKEANTFRKN